MPTLNEAKYSSLLTLTGEVPPITLNELELVRLAGLGYPTGSLNERYAAFLHDEGYSGNLNDMMSAYLSDRGFEGTLNEKMYQWWTTGQGSTGFELARLVHWDGSTTVQVQVSHAPDSVDATGWSATINDVATTMTFDSAISNILTFTIGATVISDTIRVSYNGAGNTIYDGQQLKAFSNQVASNTPEGGYSWAAAGSLDTLSDGASTKQTEADRHILYAQIVGAGKPAFVTPPDLHLPDFEGVYREVAENTAPWYGARWDNGVAYDDDGAGTPLDPVPSLYVAPAAENSLLWSRDLTNAAWSKFLDTTVAYNQVGLTGEPNTATLATVTANGTSRAIAQDVTVVADTSTTSCKTYIKKDSDQSRFVDIRLYFTEIGGLQPQIRVRLNTQTGDSRVVSFQGTTSHEVIDDGDFWIVAQSIVNSGTKTIVSFNLYPAASSDWLTDVNPIGAKSCIVGNIELHPNKTISLVKGLYPIFTQGVAVSNAAIGATYDSANNNNSEGCYYAEITPLSYVVNGGGAIIVGSTYPKIQVYGQGSENVPFRATSRDNANSSIIPYANYTGSGVGRTHKAGVAYSQVEGLKTVYADTGSVEAIYSDFRAGLQITNAGAAALIRNVRRYTLPYAEAKAKIDELMAL